MPALGREVGQTMLKGFSGTVPRVAPHLAVGFARLLVGGPEEGAVVFLGQGLPVKIERSRKARLAGAFPASVLVYDHSSNGFYAGRNPYRVVDGKNQLSGFLGGFVAYSMVRWLCLGEDVVGWLLTEQRVCDKEKKNGGTIHRRGKVVDSLARWQASDAKLYA
jgi:hypothetical protein